MLFAAIIFAIGGSVITQIICSTVLEYRSKDANGQPKYRSY